ncbi:MAG: acyl-CoA dehydrogenase family protein [Myxococcota bacterium]
MSASHPFLTEKRLEIQARARRFAQEEVLPVANELDPQQRDIPQELLKRMGELGYFGITISQEYGGMGKGVFEYALIAEELARAWMSVASIIARAQGMGTQVADPERRDELLRRSARGEWIGAAALSEPNVGSDLAGVECWAEREGDEYVITGEKRWCGNALGSHFIQLLARTEHPAPGEHRAKGIQSFILEKPPGEFPRGMTGEPIPKIGYHGITSYALHLDGVRVPAGNRIGARSASQARKGAGGAFNATMQGLAVARIHTAARAIGLSRGSLEDALAYAQEREQFGKPIASFQALRFKLADMATEIEAARSLMYLVADQVDRGLPVEKEAAMVKLFATEMAERVTSAGLQVHGGNGYTTERAVERYWRDARLTTIFEGTSEIQRKIISDQLLRKPRGE